MRRDPRVLASDGALRKVYGGAVSLGRQADTSSETIDRGNFRTVAHKANSLIQPRQCIYLDESDACIALAKELPAGQPLTIVSHSIAVLQSLAHNGDSQIVAIGGLYDIQSQSTYGAAAAAMVGRLAIDMFFLGNCRISAQGAAVEMPRVAELTSLVAKRSKEIVVLGGEALFGMAPFMVADAANIAHLISTHCADQQLDAQLRQSGIQLSVVEDTQPQLSQ